MSDKSRIFASDNDEPTALAVDSGKSIPILTGEAARRFFEHALKVEEEVKKHKEDIPKLDELKRELLFQKFFLEDNERQIQERKDRINELENKIKDLEQYLNGKS